MALSTLFELFVQDSFVAQEAATENAEVVQKAFDAWMERQGFYVAAPAPTGGLLLRLKDGRECLLGSRHQASAGSAGDMEPSGAVQVTPDGASPTQPAPHIKVV